MIEKRIGSGGAYLTPEFDDVMNATDLGTEHQVDDWPWGRKHRCKMNFMVEKNKHGERFVKQSRFAGQLYKPKTGVYATRVKIIKIDGKIGHVKWNNSYGHFYVSLEDGRYFDKIFHSDEAKELAKKFFEVK
ncbi:hypothetical protein KAR91_75080 [Candidatus Pacearchaeota archaeon]|nr:hypothetical protein [Candidatus Pacearchaeota archaeon]